mgnify:CR=1 FL=1
MSSFSDMKPLPPAEHDGSAMEGDRLFKRLFLSPTVIILLAFSIFPLLWSLGVSVTTCQRSVVQTEDSTFNLGSVLCLGNPANLSGDNFSRVTTDPRLLTADKNKLLYEFEGVSIQ